MSIALRLLLIEDSERDAQLVLRNLRQGGYEPEYLRVQTAPDLRAALSTREWDVVVADHSLPGFDSHSALLLVREAGLDLPFLIVSGTISDEEAVAAMRAGAHDYIFKENLARLVPAVRRELLEAAERRSRQRAEEALHQQDILLRSIVHHSIDLVGILDSDGAFLVVSPSVTAILGYQPGELTGKPIFELPHLEDASTLISALLRAETPAGPAVPVECRILHRNGSWRSLEFVSSGLPSGLWVGGVVINARDITDRRRAEEQLRRGLEDARDALAATVTALSTALESRDPYTAGHQQRVAAIASAIADSLQLPDNQRETIRVAGVLHDIGKIQVPAEILSKPGCLTENEMALVRGHSEAGYAILSSLSFGGPVAQTVLQHHERLDGSGYPAGLSGDGILLEARILCVADVIEAMSTHRPYRPALGLQAALGEIRAGAGVVYDPAVALACQDVFTHTDLARRLKLELSPEPNGLPNGDQLDLGLLSSSGTLKERQTSADA